MASWWLPKRGGGHRRMATLSLRDGAAWHRLGGMVAAALEPRLRPAVMANRAAGDGLRWRLALHGPALIRARRAAAVLATGAGILVRADVAAFYPSVGPSVLHRSLEAVGVQRAEARAAADMVEGWGSEGYPGLPIGPPASAVMANAVLREADGAVGRFPSLRWVDDYLVAAPREQAAREAVDRLDAALAALGLGRNEPKTEISEPGDRFTWLGLSIG